MPDSSSTPPPLNEEQDLYEISAVARQTGLSTHNLRIWERRHKVVEPVRSASQRRLYSRDDVQKLSLLKNLVDRGQSISSLAKLEISQLKQRLQDDEAANGATSGHADATTRTRRCRVAVAGPFVRTVFQEEGLASDQIRVVSEHADLDDLQSSVKPGSVDVVLIEEATLFKNQIEAIQRMLSSIKARRAVVTYRFAPKSVIAPIDNNLSSITTIRAPADANELRLACLAGMTLSRADLGAESEALDQTESPDPLASEDEAIPERTYSDSELNAISRMDNTIKCECPQHLASLVTSLLAFETYSSQCENQDAKDAELHAYLHAATAKARTAMEQALNTVLRAEDLGPVG
jgi:DNA-binding transcriptional MerR regulator